jgi:cardiolipin synthase
MLNLPNSLTLVRIVTIPVFLVLLSMHLHLAALAVFIVGGVTDALDGMVARIMHQQTPLGAYLDPVADKLLIMSSFAMLSLFGGIPLWLGVLVVSRDLIILAGFLMIYFLAGERLEARPSPIGKLNTLLQLLMVCSDLLQLHEPEILPYAWILSLTFTTAATTVISGLHYIYRGLVWLQNRSYSLHRLS